LLGTAARAAGQRHRVARQPRNRGARVRLRRRFRHAGESLRDGGRAHAHLSLPRTEAQPASALADDQTLELISNFLLTPSPGSRHLKASLKEKQCKSANLEKAIWRIRPLDSAAWERPLLTARLPISSR